MVRPGYKQTEVGEIPEDWEVKAIRDYNPFITSGSRGWASYYSEYGSPFIRITNMSRKSIYLDMVDTKHVALPDSAKEGKRTILKNKDLLISITADVGISSYVDESVEKPAYINQHIALVRFDAETIISKYICYFLASERVQKLFKSNADQGAKVGMNLDSVRSIIFALPQLSEQKAIAEALSDVDELIVSLEKLIAKKRDIKTATMQQLLTGKKRLPGVGEGKGTQKTELGEIPEDWGLVTIDQSTDCLDFLRVPLNESQRSKMIGDIPYCGANGIVDWVNDYVVDDDIILMAEDGGYFDEYATRPIAYRIVGKCWVNNHAHILKAKNRFSQAYIFYSLVHKDIQKYLASGTRAKLNKSEMAKIELVMPADENEQVAISDILSDMDSEISSLEERLNKTKFIKQGMMQELLTGRTRLVDIDTHQVEEERLHGT